MQIIKYFMLFCILIASSLIGKFLAKKYVYRLEELEEIENILNIIKNKIKFTYEPIPEIFEEISENSSKNIGNIFKNAKEKMNEKSVSQAWEEAIEESENNLKKEDKKVLKAMSKLLGLTDVDGQISQIEITEKFLQDNIETAKREKQSNERLYTRLGTIMGLAIVIVLF